MTLLLGGLLATLAVFWVVHPVVAGVSAPMEREDEELTEAQHRKRVALLALRDVEYDYHAGKLDEGDYRRMKAEIAGEALEALNAEEAEWAAREGRRAAEDGAGGPEGSSRSGVDVEAEIASLRSALREGAVCRECGRPHPRGSRFCGGCGSALRRTGDESPPGSTTPDS